MTKCSLTGDFLQTPMDRASILRLEFETMLKGDTKLTDETRQEALDYFYEINDFMAENNMVLAQRSLVILMDIRRNASPLRDDGTSPFTHEFGQAIDVIRDYKDGLYNVPIDDLELDLALIFNHDTREDHKLEEQDFRRSLSAGVVGHHNYTQVHINFVCMGYDLINKKPNTDGGKYKEIHDDIYATRFGSHIYTLRTKMRDSSHNFMSLRPNHDPAKALKYARKKMRGFEINKGMVARDSTATRLLGRLKDQVTILEAYAALHEDKSKDNKVVFREVIGAMVIKYQADTRDARIHPIIGLINRITKEEWVKDLYLKGILPSPAPTPAAAPSPRPANDRGRPIPA